MDTTNDQTLESQTLVSERQTKNVRIFGVICRLKNSTLTLSELPMLCAILLGLCSLCGSCVIFMRKPMLFHGLNVRCLPILMVVVTCIQYTLTYFNIKMNGWGANNSRFWCDVRIMFVRGFNTIRTLFHFCTLPIAVVFISIIMENSVGIVYVVLLIVIAEWQFGLIENQNQYEQSVHEKFTNEQGEICLELLHTYQSNCPPTTVTWIPYFISCFINTWTFVCLFITSPHHHQQWVLETPIIVSVVVWAYILPLVFELAYLKKSCSFCQLEIYRMISDLVFLPLVMMFSLV